MRFSAIHKVASYLMCGAAFLALALSRELSVYIVAATAILGLGSFVVEPSRWRPSLQRQWTLLWNVGTLIVFALSVLEAVRGEPLVAGVRLICFLLVNKLMNRSASRDYQQAYVLSFLMLVAGAALSADLSYALCFLFYVVFCTWTLTLFHLRREMEDNYLLKHSDDAQSERVEVERILNSRRIVGGAFLVGTGLVSLGIFLASAVAFFLIPRVGVGFFASHGRKQQPTVGFSDRVELGEYGVVKDNPQIVMRVELPAGPPREPLRFRGVAFDHYQGGHWTRTRSLPSDPLVERGSMVFLDPGTKRLDEATRKRILAGTIEQRVYLDPLDTSVLFGASMPVAFEIPQKPGGQLKITAGHAGEVIVTEGRYSLRGVLEFSERKGALRYTAYSRVGPPELGKILDQPDAEVGPELRPYLSLPQMPSRVVELARALVAGRKSHFSQALAVEQYLQTRLRYTLDLKRDEHFEPIEDFLFVQKAGHCEYFASAMAIMLRAVGIPTRVVNGFIGGDWNNYGRYLAVRQGDAHSWVEVWLGKAGWVTFDPTPVGPAPVRGNALVQRMRQLVDNLELAWFKYVIEYDLSKQVDFAVGARRALANGIPPKDRLLALLRSIGKIATPIVVVAVGVLLFRRRRLAPGRRATDALLGRALDALEKRGLHRGLGETSRELGRRALEVNDPGALAFTELVERCYLVRYGHEAVPVGELDRLLSAVVRPPPRRDPGNIPPPPA